MHRKSPECDNQPRTYVSDMTHFLDENGLAPVGLPKEFYAMLNYHAAIVKAGSSHPGNTQFCSIIPCRRRPNRKPCGSYLTVTHQPDSVIHWQCPKCGEQGFISNWRETIYDLSGAIESDPTQRVSVLISCEEHKLLSKIITSSQEEDAIIAGAVLTPDGVIVSGGMEDFDLLMGSIAFDANHSEGAKHQRDMDSIYGKIERLLEE